MGNSKLRILKEELRELVASHVQENVTEPIWETVEKDLSAPGRPADRVVCLLPVVRALGDLVLATPPSIDKSWLTSLQSNELRERLRLLKSLRSESKPPANAREIVSSGLTQNHLLTYFLREIDWIVISILSGRYVSALILTRSCFELLVGTATRRRGTMKPRLEGIPYLTPRERRELLKRWASLNGWAHPHGRWVKEVCPLFASMRPMFHPKLCNTCYEELKTVVDFFLVIVHHTFHIPLQHLENAMRSSDVRTTEFRFISSRFRRSGKKQE